MFRGSPIAAALLLTVAVPAAAQTGDERLSRMLQGGPMLDQPALDEAIAAAAAYPLGSRNNPVRAAMPPGEYGYLARLRCAGGRAPTAQRDGSDGVGPFDSIIDVFTVICAGSTPAESKIYLDMYHPGYIEMRAVPGFAIEPATPVA